MAAVSRLWDVLVWLFQAALIVVVVYYVMELSSTSHHTGICGIHRSLVNPERCHISVLDNRGFHCENVLSHTVSCGPSNAQWQISDGRSETFAPCQFVVKPRRLLTVLLTKITDQWVGYGEEKKKVNPSTPPMEPGQGDSCGIIVWDTVQRFEDKDL
jgi:hypothetical protein